MRLPPLNSTRVFEAAGRHQSFSKAADELNVTPSAVSRQIKLLEEYLGVSLFVRTNKELRITRYGQIYLLSVQDALSRLEAGTQEIIVRNTDQPLHIWGSRFFIRLWLVPRLPDFHATHPRQETVITSLLSSEPMPTDVDVGLRFGKGHWSGLKSHYLIGRHLVPVCSPEYLAKSPPLEKPEDLSRHTLLQNLLGSDDWKLWYDNTDAEPVSLDERIVFTSADIAYSAALEGLGVALGRRGFIERDLEEGRLVIPFDLTVTGEGAFYLVYHDREVLSTRVVRFRRWILGQLKSVNAALHPGENYS